MEQVAGSKQQVARSKNQVASIKYQALDCVFQYDRVNNDKVVSNQPFLRFPFVSLKIFSPLHIPWSYLFGCKCSMVKCE